jgi:1-acyl-sn-glycerol-3-phosphate acyltransferase
MMIPAWLRFEKMPILYRIVLFIAYMYAKVFLRLKIEVRHPIPKGAALIAANHTSFLDPPIVSVSFPEEVHFLARKTLFDHKFFGSFIRKLNAHPIHGDGKDMAIFRTVAQLMEEGYKVILFPEGQRSYDGILKPLKQGVALMAIKSHVPIIPCWVEGAHKVWPRGQKLPRIFGKVRCIFGEPIYPPKTDDTKKALHEMTEALYEAIRKLDPKS